MKIIARMLKCGGARHVPGRSSFDKDRRAKICVRRFYDGPLRPGTCRAPHSAPENLI
jgi:hypothetical protein